jgi:hypothetical protein
VKQPVDTVEQVFVLDQLALVGLLDAFLYPCEEAGLIFEQAGGQQCLSPVAQHPFHWQGPLGAAAFQRQGKMYFHAFKVRENPE